MAIRLIAMHGLKQEPRKARFEAPSQRPLLAPPYSVARPQQTTRKELR